MLVNDTSLKPAGYIPRIADALVERDLRAFGGVEICGPRWCGKSWTSMAHGESIVLIDENASIFEDEPSLALIGPKPHVIDEWQEIPAIWNSVRHAIDNAASAPGQYVLTGSSAPLEKKEEAKRHSGAGRIARIKMATMTCHELGVSQGGVSLAGLFKGEFTPVVSDTSLGSLAAQICKGGWPALAGKNNTSSARVVEQYLTALFEVSMPKAGKSPILSRRIATSLARNIATSATVATLVGDASSGGSFSVTEQTVASYLTEFDRNYFLDLLPGWDAPVRAKSRLRTKPKRYLADPSLAAGLLGVSERRLLEDAQLFGLLFESLVIHDLGVFAQLLPGYTSQSLGYYSDANGLEVDFIIELSDGRWAGFEIKLGESKVEQATRNLKRLKAKIQANPAARNPEPVFMAVILGRGSVARHLKDENIYVLPFDVLEP